MEKISNTLTKKNVSQWNSVSYQLSENAVTLLKKNKIRKTRKGHYPIEEKAIFIGISLYYPELGSHKLLEQTKQLSIEVNAPEYIVNNVLQANGLGSKTNRKDAQALIKKSIYPLNQFLELTINEKTSYLQAIGHSFIRFTEEKNKLLNEANLKTIANRVSLRQSNFLAWYGETVIKERLAQEHMQTVSQANNRDSVLNQSATFYNQPQNKISHYTTPVSTAVLLSNFSSFSPAKKQKCEDSSFSHHDREILFPFCK